MTAMPTTRRIRGPLRQVGLMAFAISVSITAAAWSTPCDQTLTPPVVPDCELQQQAPVHYWSWETSGWAYYCTGDHPYFWGMQQGFILNYTWDNSCFSVTENVFADNLNNLDATITNWCLHRGGEDLTVTLGCSSMPPPGSASCKLGDDPVRKDPGCPQSDSHTFCSSTNPPVCLLTAIETCPDGTEYFCSFSYGITTCYKCVAS